MYFLKKSDKSKYKVNISIQKRQKKSPFFNKIIKKFKATKISQNDTEKG